jgi:OPA family sugar phosphate sensor protein UhpC-like MFS transporter
MTETAREEAGTARRAWVLSFVAYATYYFGRKGFGVAKKSIEHDLGIGRDGLAAIDTGHLALYAVGQFANGVLADRVGARRLVGFGMLASAAACAWFGASSAALSLFLAFSVNGYAQSTGWPGTTRAMADWTTDENRRRVMALWATCYQVGGIGASAAAAWLLRYGWRSAFYVPAVLLAVVGSSVLVGLPAQGERFREAKARRGAVRASEARRGSSRVSELRGPHEAPNKAMATRSPRELEAARGPLREGAGAPGTAHVETDDNRSARKRAVRDALSSPTLWCFGASYFAIKLIRYSLLFWLPYYLSDDLGYAPSAAGYLSTAFEVGGVVGVVATGLFTHRARSVSRPALSAAMLAALAAMIVLYTKVAPLGAGANATGLALIGVFLFGPDSLLSGAVAQDAGGPRAAATATGMVNGIGSLGAVLQGALNAWVSRRFGWHAVFLSFVTFSVVAAVTLVPTFGRDGVRRRPA